MAVLFFLSNSLFTENYGRNFKLPGTKLVGIGNNVSDNGTIYPFLNGKNTNTDYRVFDILGRNITTSNNFSNGKYFLQVFDKITGDILGTQGFINYGGKLNVEFKIAPTQYLGKITREDADSPYVLT